MPMMSYREGLLERLAEPEYTAIYLKTALDELAQEQDFEMFLLALENVREARESIEAIPSLQG